MFVIIYLFFYLCIYLFIHLPLLIGTFQIILVLQKITFLEGITFYFCLMWQVTLYKKRSFLRIWSLLLKKSLMVNFIFCAVINDNTLPCYWNITIRFISVFKLLSSTSDEVFFEKCLLSLAFSR